MSLLLARIALREIRLPLREPFRISSGVVADRRILLLELADADGATGWSECVAFDDPFYGPDTVDTAWIAIEARRSIDRRRRAKTTSNATTTHAHQRWTKWIRKGSWVSA